MLPISHIRLVGGFKNLKEGCDSSIFQQLISRIFGFVALYTGGQFILLFFCILNCYGTPMGLVLGRSDIRVFPVLGVAG